MSSESVVPSMEGKSDASTASSSSRRACAKPLINPLCIQSQLR
jgi:hypothetical protein